MSERDRLTEIYKALKSVSIVRDKYLCWDMARSLLLLPKEVADFAIKNCIFISAMGAYGSFISIESSVKENKKNFILLDGKVWDERPIKRTFIMAHEIAHAYRHLFLKEENQYESEDIERKLENIEQDLVAEEKTNKLAIDWLSKHYARNSLERLGREATRLLRDELLMWKKRNKKLRKIVWFVPGRDSKK